MDVVGPKRQRYPFKIKRYRNHSSDTFSQVWWAGRTWLPYGGRKRGRNPSARHPSSTTRPSIFRFRGPERLGYLLNIDPCLFDSGVVGTGNPEKHNSSTDFSGLAGRCNLVNTPTVTGSSPVNYYESSNCSSVGRALDQKHQVAQLVRQFFSHV